MQELFGEALLHIDPDYVWSVLGDSVGEGENENSVHMRVELFGEAQGGLITFRGRDMHIVGAVNVRISASFVNPSADCFVRIAGIRAAWSMLPLFVGPGQLWKGCPFVSILSRPGKPAQSALFLLTFSCALLWGASLTDHSYQGVPLWLDCQVYTARGGR